MLHLIKHPSSLIKIGKRENKAQKNFPSVCFANFGKKQKQQKLASNESHVRASHTARKTAIRKAYRFCERETLHQASAGFHVRRLINARFHPAFLPPLHARETLSFGSVVRRIIVIPNSAALMDIGERFWCIVQPRFDAFSRRHLINVSFADPRLRFFDNYRPCLVP